MLISIITANLNGEKYLRQNINSILNQDYKFIEHIFVDSLSKDSSLEIINSYKDEYQKRGYKLVIESKKDDGIYFGMNNGLKLASGEIIGFLNSDDFLAKKNSISLIAKEFLQDIDCVYGHVNYLDDKGKIIREFRSKEFKKGDFKNAIHPAHPSFYVREEFLKDGFDTRFKIASDFYLMCNLLEVKSLKHKLIDEVLVNMQDGGTSNKSIKNILKANIECYKALKDNNIDVSKSFIIKKPIKKIQQIGFKNLLLKLKATLG